MLSLLRLVAAWLTLFMIGTDLFVVAPLLPLISHDYRVGASGAGLAVTAFSAGYVVAAPIFGHLADRLGRRRVLTGCLVAFALGNLLTAEAISLPTMMVARLLCGIAAAGVTPSIYVLVGSTAPPGQRGTRIAIVLTGLLSSLPLGAPIGHMVSLVLGWPIVFYVLGACSLLLAPVHHSLWPAMRQAPSSAPYGALPASFSGLALAQRIVPTVAWSTALYSMYTYLAAGLARLGYHHATIDEIIFIYGAAGFAGALLGGRIADRLSTAIAIRLSLIGLCACFVFLRFAVQQGAYAATAFAMTALLAQIYFPAQQSLLLSEFPSRSATALSWNNSGLFLGIGLGSLIGGQAMALGGFTAILPISAAIAIIGWVSFDYWLPRTKTPRTT